MKENLVGQKFGRLSVVSFSHKKGGTYYWNCVCDCGTERLVTRGALIKGTTKSCGCLKGERGAAFFRTHGMYRDRLYHIHENIKQRCKNPKNDNFIYYGGKGVKICKEWLKFEDFLGWAMANGYKEGLTIDRIDNNKDYCPENCRWVTTAIQARNTCRNIFLTLNNKTQCLADWSSELGIHYGTLHARKKQGLSDEAILTIPVKRRKETINEEGR